MKNNKSTFVIAVICCVLVAVFAISNVSASRIRGGPRGKPLAEYTNPLDVWASKGNCMTCLIGRRAGVNDMWWTFGYTNQYLRDLWQEQIKYCEKTFGFNDACRNYSPKKAPWELMN